MRKNHGRAIAHIKTRSSPAAAKTGNPSYAAGRVVAAPRDEAADGGADVRSGFLQADVKALAEATPSAMAATISSDATATPVDPIRADLSAEPQTAVVAEEAALRGDPRPKKAVEPEKPAADVGQNQAELRRAAEQHDDGSGDPGMPDTRNMVPAADVERLKGELESANERLRYMEKSRARRANALDIARLQLSPKNKKIHAALVASWANDGLIKRDDWAVVQRFVQLLFFHGVMLKGAAS